MVSILVVILNPFLVNFSVYCKIHLGVALVATGVTSNTKSHGVFGSTPAPWSSK